MAGTESSNFYLSLEKIEGDAVILTLWQFLNRLVWMEDFNIFQQAIDDWMMDEANQQRTQNWIFQQRKYERVDVMGNGPLMTRPYREWYQIGGLTAFPPGPYGWRKWEKLEEFAPTKPNECATVWSISTISCWLPYVPVNSNCLVL